MKSASWSAFGFTSVMHSSRAAASSRAVSDDGIVPGTVLMRSPYNVQLHSMASPDAISIQRAAALHGQSSIAHDSFLSVDADALEAATADAPEDTLQTGGLPGGGGSIGIVKQGQIGSSDMQGALEDVVQQELARNDGPRPGTPRGQPTVQALDAVPIGASQEEGNSKGGGEGGRG